MAYAAVVSLVQTIASLVSSKSKIDIPDSEFEYIVKELRYLQRFLEAIRSLPSSERVEAPWSNRAKDAAKKLEDLIDSHISDLFLSGILSESSTDHPDEGYLTLLLFQQLPKVRREITCFTTMLTTDSRGTEEDHDHQQHEIDSLSGSETGSGSESERPPRNSLLFDAVLEMLRIRREIRYMNNLVMTNQSQSTIHCGDEKREFKMVGLDDQLKELKDFVLSPRSELCVISVCGMTGIGKTSLVKQVYDDPIVAQKFEHKLFLPIGPRFQLDEIVLLARRQLGIHSDDDKVFDHEDDDEDEDEADYHVDQLTQFLLGTKYLIVLDGIWNHWTWNDLKHVYPNNEKGSRIIVTTQMLSLAFDSGYDTLKIRFLGDDESWNLLRETVFGTNEEKCDPRLEKVGKKIAKKCEGLPLAIIQVGELLRTTEKTVEKWEEIAENEDPFNITRSDDTPLSNALSLSYTMLPQYLKVCLLYTSAFPKDSEIRRNKLIQLWLSESLVEQQICGTFEAIAAEYLRKLIHQSVVLSNKPSSIDMEAAKTCRLHFIFRSLSVNEAESEKFFHVIKSYADSFPESTASHQRLCIHNNVVLAFKQVHEWMESIPNARSLLCFGPKQQHQIALYLRFRLLKVLDALAIRFYEFPDQVLELFHLRYLAITYDRDELPASISCLWNLRYLIVHRHHNIKKSLDAHAYLPMEIWKLHNLKHLECMGFELPDPSSSSATAEDDSLILENLLTLLGVSPKSCTEGVLARIPWLAKIGIQIESAHDSLETFEFFGDQFASHYKKFESFKCVVVNPNLSRTATQVVPSSVPINFPEYIRKITLSGCGFPWEYIRVIAELPNLEVLKLRWYAFCGPEWKTHEAMEFPNLKYLLLEDLDIERCVVGSHENFPRLRSLVIRHCYNLREMSSHFGEVEMIEMEDCSPSAMVWAAKIGQERLLEFGPAGTQLHLHSSWDDKPRRS